MDMLDNHNIRTKLSTLNSLPKGYTPNLESKWSMLEAGLSGQTKRNTLWKPVRVAAMLLLLGGASLLIPLIKQKPIITADTKYKHSLFSFSE